METSIIAPIGSYTNKHKAEEKNHKRISYMAIAAIIVVAVSIGVYFSLYSSSSSFFLFSNSNSEVIIPAPLAIKIGKSVST